MTSRPGVSSSAASPAFASTAAASRTSRIIPRSTTDKTGTSGSFTCSSKDHICAVFTIHNPDKLFAKIASPQADTPGARYAGPVCLRSAPTLPQVLPAPLAERLLKPSLPTVAGEPSGLQQSLFQPAPFHSLP